MLMLYRRFGVTGCHHFRYKTEAVPVAGINSTEYTVLKPVRLQYKSIKHLTIPLGNEYCISLTKVSNLVAQLLDQSFSH